MVAMPTIIGSKLFEKILSLITGYDFSKSDSSSGSSVSSGSSGSPGSGSWDSDSATDNILDDNLWTYLDGLFTSVGAENALNRDFNSAEAAANREFQASEAAKQRQWYEQMSNTAYQRSVNDMKAAGLNPILAVSSGFSGASSSATQVPAGSAASSTSSGGDSISDILTAIAALISSYGNAASGIGRVLSAFTNIG